MIYTLTLNPSIDYTVTVSEFCLGELNRSGNEKFFPGGKGINVSLVLKELGIASTTLGFVGGFTGEQIRSMLAAHNIDTDFLETAGGCSRVNVKMRETESGLETEMNGSGPVISREEKNRLFDRLLCLGEKDTLVLAGSIPRSLPDTIYEEICGLVRPHAVRVVVDASGDLLRRVLVQHPFLIKPNRQELEELFGVQIKDREDAICYAQKLRQEGAQQVLVSLAGDGAVLVGEGGAVYQMDAPDGKRVNSVGSGDSVIAGFLAGLELGKPVQDAFRLGVCAGSATAFSEGLACRGGILRLYEDLKQKEDA